MRLSFVKLWKGKLLYNVPLFLPVVFNDIAIFSRLLSAGGHVGATTGVHSFLRRGHPLPPAQLRLPATIGVVPPGPPGRQRLGLLLACSSRRFGSSRSAASSRSRPISYCHWHRCFCVRLVGLQHPSSRGPSRPRLGRHSRARAGFALLLRCCCRQRRPLGRGPRVKLASGRRLSTWGSPSPAPAGSQLLLRSRSGSSPAPRETISELRGMEEVLLAFSLLALNSYPFLWGRVLSL